MSIQTVSQAFANEGIGGFSFRNRIINGAMEIDQRNGGASVSANDGTFALDRTYFNMQTNSKGTGIQSTDAPIGFKNSLSYTNGSAYTVGASETYGILQNIEGTNIVDLSWGTANAKDVTLSFWVKSSVTGTHGGVVKTTSGSPAYSYAFPYTINSANTWEYKTITIPGPTVGTWVTTTSVGIRLGFGLGNGSNNSIAANSWTAANAWSVTGAVSVLATAGATWQITGIQLEVGTKSTPFERRPYGTELALCQRYYYRLKQTSGLNCGVAAGVVYTTTTVYGLVNFPVEMRVAPTALEQNGTAGDYDTLTNGNLFVCTSVPVFENATVTTSLLQWRYSSATVTVGSGAICRMRNPTSYLAWSAEL